MRQPLVTDRLPGGHLLVGQIYSLRLDATSYRSLASSAETVEVLSELSAFRGTPVGHKWKALRVWFDEADPLPIADFTSLVAGGFVVSPYAMQRVVGP